VGSCRRGAGRHIFFPTRRVQLLVVIAIIAVLAALLLPALARARGEARRIQCLSNLRQMFIAVQLYTDNYNGYYPPAYYTEIKDGVFISHAWDFTTIKDWSTGETRVIPGILWGETGDISAVHQCPSYYGGHNWLDDPHTGYNYNTSYIGRGSGETVKTPAKVTDVKDPSNTALFGDGEFSSGANKFMRSPFSSPFDAGFSGRAAGTQGFRHNGATNVIFCDGHAASLRKCYTNTSSHEQENITGNTGFLSPDNSLYDLE